MSPAGLLKHLAGIGYRDVFPPGKCSHGSVGGRCDRRGGVLREIMTKAREAESGWMDPGPWGGTAREVAERCLFGYSAPSGLPGVSNDYSQGVALGWFIGPPLGVWDVCPRLVEVSTG